MSMPIGGTHGFWIRPEDVREAGEAARTVARDIPADIKTLYGPTDAAVAALGGLTSATALDDCLEAWAKALRSLAGMVETAGDAFGASGSALTREDHTRGKALDRIPYAPGVEAPSNPYARDGVVPPYTNGGH
ncbi:hypothetical protein [Streptomyces xanthochromogenes]|nr:hypothetical protein [Streptomyces xanthochromogenes]